MTNIVNWARALEYGMPAADLPAGMRMFYLDASLVRLPNKYFALPDIIVSLDINFMKLLWLNFRIEIIFHLNSNISRQDR